MKINTSKTKIFVCRKYATQKTNSRIDYQKVVQCGSKITNGIKCGKEIYTSSKTKQPDIIYLIDNILIKCQNLLVSRKKQLTNV